MSGEVCVCRPVTIHHEFSGLVCAFSARLLLPELHSANTQSAPEISDLEKNTFSKKSRLREASIFLNEQRSTVQKLS